MQLGRVLAAVVTLAAHSHAQDIPRNDHDGFHYFAFKLSGPEGSNADLKLARRAALHARAYDIASALDMHFLGHVGELEDYFQVAVPKSTAATLVRRQAANTLDGAVHDQIEQILGNHDAIEWAQTLEAKMRYQKRSVQQDPDLVSSDDTRRSMLATRFEIADPLFEWQWHILNDTPGQVGHDHNVTAAWEMGIFGNGSTVCIVDDGLDHSASDLKDNYYAEGSYDFNVHSPDPMPKLGLDRHGTRCAGEIAAVRNNVCGVGIAYGARVSATRILGSSVTQADEAASINYKFHDNHIYSCSWGPTDDGRTMEEPSELVAAAFKNGVENGRNGLGSIFVFASGNGGASADNCNFDGFTNSIYTITVSSLDRFNRHPEYSEACAANMVVMYSSADMRQNDAIATTDWSLGHHGDLCTKGHGGTSAAAPLASAIYALVNSLRPDLSWRDYQHLSIRSAVPINTADPSWFTTQAGRQYSHEFGYGKLDAYRILTLAKDWTTVRNQVHIRTSFVAPAGNGSIEAGAVAVARFEFTEEMRKAGYLAALEHVTVTVHIQHPKRGDVCVDLVSPHGIKSKLAVPRQYDKANTGFNGWTFSSVIHWDEDPIGTWQIVVHDRSLSDAPKLPEVMFFGGGGATIGKPGKRGAIPAIFEKASITWWGSADPSRPEIPKFVYDPTESPAGSDVAANKEVSATVTEIFAESTLKATSSKMTTDYLTSQSSSTTTFEAAPTSSISLPSILPDVASSNAIEDISEPKKVNVINHRTNSHLNFTLAVGILFGTVFVGATYFLLIRYSKTPRPQSEGVKFESVANEEV
ncbi:peptidase S8/S53 domain-containing protein [Chytriomyces sp. MP71]|nr:peptidase S8/S53 domain-containing protein [Chytriomyces sp. MP71]